LLLGDINEESAGHLWDDLKPMSAYLNDPLEPFEQHVATMAHEIHEHHGKRSRLKNSPRIQRPDLWKQVLFRDTALNATQEYFDEFYNGAWPNYVEMIWTKIMRAAEDRAWIGQHIMEKGSVCRRAWIGQHIKAKGSVCRRAWIGQHIKTASSKLSWWPLGPHVLRDT
jgi:hypothetical protein